MHPYRSHTCGELRPEEAGQTVRLSGWVHRKRDHGGVIFIDLRDHYGITQVVCNPGQPFFADAERARSESVVTVTGEVCEKDNVAVTTAVPPASAMLLGAADNVTVGSAAASTTSLAPTPP